MYLSFVSDYFSSKNTHHILIPFSTNVWSLPWKKPCVCKWQNTIKCNHSGATNSNKLAAVLGQEGTTAIAILLLHTIANFLFLFLQVPTLLLCLWS